MFTFLGGSRVWSSGVFRKTKRMGERNGCFSCWLTDKRRKGLKWISNWIFPFYGQTITYLFLLFSVFFFFILTVSFGKTREETWANRQWQMHLKFINAISTVDFVRKCGIFLTFVNGSVGVGLLLSTCQAAKRKKEGNFIFMWRRMAFETGPALSCQLTLLRLCTPFESGHLALSLLLQPTPLFCMNLIRADNAIIYGFFLMRKQS